MPAIATTAVERRETAEGARRRASGAARVDAADGWRAAKRTDWREAAGRTAAEVKEQKRVTASMVRMARAKGAEKAVRPQCKCRDDCDAVDIRWQADKRIQAARANIFLASRRSSPRASPMMTTIYIYIYDL